MFGRESLFISLGIDEFPNISLPDLDTLMAEIAPLGVPVLAHCELDTLPAPDKLSANPRSYAAYLSSRPKAWENEAIKAFIALAEKNNCKAHIVHLASDEMLDWIAEKKDPRADKYCLPTGNSYNSDVELNCKKACGLC